VEQIGGLQNAKSYAGLDLVPNHLAVLDVAPYLLNLAPVQVAQRLAGPGNGVFYDLLKAFVRRPL
jgi:hypothetical protein